jgi:hypothetical protein
MKPPRTSRSATGDGPFAEAARRADRLATNIYLTSLCTQTIEQLKVAQEQYELAVIGGDLFEIEKSRNELEFIEEIIKITAQNYEIAVDDVDESRSQ